MLYGKPAPPPKYEDLEQPPKYEDLGPEFGAGAGAAGATAVVNVETETAAASATALPTIPQVRSDCQNGAANK